MQAEQAPYALGDDGCPDAVTIYLLCPYCSVTAVPLGLTYAPADTGGIDPAHPLGATCALCVTEYTTTAAAIQPRTAERVCARCGLTVPVPGSADEVVCPACRLYQPGPAALPGTHRAAAVNQIRATYAPAVRALLRARFGLPIEDAQDRPNYLDDPLMEVVRAAHQLMLHPDPRARGVNGPSAMFGACSCNEWVTPTWDTPATIVEAYDEHMTDVQTSIHGAQPPR